MKPSIDMLLLARHLPISVLAGLPSYVSDHSAQRVSLLRVGELCDRLFADGDIARAAGQDVANPGRACRASWLVGQLKVSCARQAMLS